MIDKSVININYRYLFFILIFLELLIALGVKYLFLNDVIYYQSFNQQLSISKIDKILEVTRRWQWVGYAMLPLITLSRVFYTSIFLYIGIFFTELKIEFGRLFKITLLADFVFVFAGLAKLVILIFFKQVNTLEDLQFTPLSIMELLNGRNIDSLFVYPLSLLNVFELAYFLVLAWLLVGVINETSEERPMKFMQSLKLVAASYGSGLLLWVLVVMFITLNLG